MKVFKSVFYLCFAMLFLFVAGQITDIYAGGPLFVASNGKPVIWAKQETKGGPIGSSTVNAQGQVLYRVDGGPLGPLSNAEAVKIVDRIFKLYTDIPTSTIEFVNAGQIKSPVDNTPIDVNRNNVGMVLSSRNPTLQNPIVFDSDGGITGGGGTLGFFTFLAFSRPDSSTLALAEGAVVLNGPAINSIGKVPFIGVFTHEFGHFAGPLDHSQLNGGIAASSSFATLPDGFANSSQRFDVFGPFIETVYPFLFSGPSTSRLANLGFRSSGGFIASLSFDDNVAMSALYPAPGYLPSEAGSQIGGITGKVLIRTPSKDFSITGLNVVARRVSQGKYPPDPNLDVYRGSVPVDADGAPQRPTNRPEIDPLITATSFVSGVIDNNGTYQFIGLPPGDYLVSVERINPSFLGGSSVGPREEQLNLAIPENYNGANEGNAASDNPKDFTPVKVVAGAITPNIDIILNGFGLASLTSSGESEPNDSKKQSQKLGAETIITGRIAASDPAKVFIDFGQGDRLPVQDLYRIDLKSPSSLYISLEAADVRSDIDVVLFSKGIKNGSISINSAFVLNTGLTVTGSELIGTGLLQPGTYFIGVAAGVDSDQYTLTILGQK
ncbi:MAG: hypothetical protein J0M03_07395 [Acidobacteria bacterium]|nr:hypothetical protein [Acidobacteriota bacterium]